MHCASRLGFMTWMYQNREEIAYSLGFIHERPITMCGRVYDLDRAVKIEAVQHDTDNMPAPALPVSDINLFIDFSDITQKVHNRSFLAEVFNNLYQPHACSSPAYPIFQPPRV